MACSSVVLVVSADPIADCIIRSTARRMTKAQVKETTKPDTPNRNNHNGGMVQCTKVRAITGARAVTPPI